METRAGRAVLIEINGCAKRQPAMHRTQTEFSLELSLDLGQSKAAAKGDHGFLHSGRSEFMDYITIIVLSGIVSAFSLFAVVLGYVDYATGVARRARQAAATDSIELTVSSQRKAA